MSPVYPKHDATLLWAVGQIGQHEVPPGSNRGAFVQTCQAATWLGGTGWAWCRAFSLRAHLHGGFVLPDGSAGAWDALRRAQGRGDAIAPQAYQHAIPGDEVIWSFGTGHCSILERFETKVIGGLKVVTVVTVDGNVSDRVERCQRPLALVRGFIHWRETASVVLTKPPRAQVVGSISGSRQLVTKKGLIIPLRPKKPGLKGIVPPAPVKVARREPRTPKAGPLVKPGAKGEAVRRLQLLLKHSGARLEVDGVYGPKTREAVETFQKRHGLRHDGTVNAKTWIALENGKT